jgi:hypothetical protein
MGELQQGAWGKSSKATRANEEVGTRNAEVKAIDSPVHQFIFNEEIKY